MFRSMWSAILGLAALAAIPAQGIAQHAIMPNPAELPPYLGDRGTGTPSSMFGTYIREGELIIYTFFEYYINEDEEYNLKELGFGPDEDFEGSFTETEYLIFLGYGLTEDVMIELEAAVYTSATLKKSPNDTSALPDELTESGLGDVQTLIAWRWLRETESNAGYFSFLEIVFPFQKDKIIIGTPDWEFKLGIGIINGFSWGTVTMRFAIEYERLEDEVAFGEYAFEYLKRLSPSWRVYLAVEGDDEEVEMIPEVQWHFSKTALLKFNSAFGLTPSAKDWAPEIGVMMSF